MKRLFVFYAAFTLSMATVSASNNIYNRDEVSISYGVATIMDIADFFSSEVILPTVTLGNMVGDNPDYMGAVSLDYTHRISKVVGFGVTAAYSRVTSDFVTTRDESATDHHSEDYFILMPHAKFNWLNTSYVTLYSKIGVGGCYERMKETYQDDKSTKNDWAFAFQVSPLGIEVGKNICGFAEVGIGHCGLAQVGVRYKF